MRESSIVRAIQKELATRPNVRVKKNHGGRYSEAGEPDLLVHWVASGGCRPTVLAYIEVKVVGNKPTPAQFRMLSRLSDCGAHTTWVSSASEAIRWLESLGLPARRSS